MINYRYTIFTILILLISCSAEQENDPTVDGAAEYDEEFTPHPQPERMPHPDIESNELELRDVSEILSELPENLQLLYNYLNDDNQNLRQKELSLIVSSQYGFHAATKDENTLIVLDENDNRFIQYDLQNDEYVNLAPQGRGPGDIMFTKEMQLHDNSASIAMQGFRISVFDCQFEECEYDRTISTEFNTYSLAPEKDRLTILGLPPFGRDQDPDPDNIDQHTIHHLNGNDEVEKSFSPVYQHKNPILRDAMNSNGKVRAFPNHNTQMVAFSFFPYLYMYNYQGELVDKYKIPGFKQGYYDHKEEAGGSSTGRYRHNDNSSISGFSKIDDEWVLVQLRERRDLNFEDRSLIGNEWFSYYALNVGSGELYEIGEDEKKKIGENSTIHATDHGLVVNEQGTLSWVSSR